MTVNSPNIVDVKLTPKVLKGAEIAKWMKGEEQN